MKSWVMSQTHTAGKLYTDDLQIYFFFTVDFFSYAQNEGYLQLSSPVNYHLSLLKMAQFFLVACI